MTAKICGIYKITNPKGRIYIGQSVNIKSRLNTYKNESCIKQSRLYRSIKKYGWSKHKVEIIHECKREELNDLEKYYVDLFQTFNSEYGMNLREGGGNRTRFSDETIKKMSDFAKTKTGSKNSFYKKPILMNSKKCLVILKAE